MAALTGSGGAEAAEQPAKKPAPDLSADEKSQLQALYQNRQQAGAGMPVGTPPTPDQRRLDEEYSFGHQSRTARGNRKPDKIYSPDAPYRPMFVPEKGNDLPTGTPAAAPPADTLYTQLMPPSKQPTPEQALAAGKSSPEARAAEDKGFSLSNQDLIMMGLGILGNGSQHWQNMIGKGGLEGLQASRQQKAAEAKALYERQMGEKAEAMGDYYRTRAEHPELFASGYYSAQGRLDNTQLKELQTEQQAILAQLHNFENNPLAQLNTPAKRAELEARLQDVTARLHAVGSQHAPEGGTVAPAPAGNTSGRVIDFNTIR